MADKGTDKGVGENDLQRTGRLETERDAANQTVSADRTRGTELRQHHGLACELPKQKLILRTASEVQV